MNTALTARFWTWIHDGPVKISLRPGQRLRHCFGGPTDEGWHRESSVWEWDGEVLRSSLTSDGADCDGRCTNHYDGFTTPDKLAARPYLIQHPQNPFCDIPHPSGIAFPEWTEAKSWQRDYSAEAAGY